jgi:hypothetical protein
MKPSVERVRPFALRIPEQLFAQLQALAKEEKRSINAQILHMLEQAYASRAKGEDRSPAKKGERR